MRDRLSALRISNVMSMQRHVWEGTPNADQIITDCCHALATALELTREQRKKFLRQCERPIYIDPEGEERVLQPPGNR